MNNQWPFDQNWTEAQLVDIRKKSIEDYAKHVAPIHEGNMKFTCDDCPDRFVCDLVFDFYNTDGDCLASK